MQTLNGLHSLFRHVLLRENDGDLFRTVIAVVKEDHYIALGYTSVAVSVHKRLHELVRVLVLIRMAVVASLYGCYHIRLFSTFTVHQLVICHFDALPAFVAVHRIESTDDGSDMCARTVTYTLKGCDKTLTATRVGVTPVHETVNIRLVGYAVLLGYLHQFEEMIQRTVYTAVRAQTHDMQFLTCCLCSLVSRYYLGVLHDRVIADGAVDLH